MIGGDTCLCVCVQIAFQENASQRKLISTSIGHMWSLTHTHTHSQCVRDILSHTVQSGSECDITLQIDVHLSDFSHLAFLSTASINAIHR